MIDGESAITANKSNFVSRNVLRDEFNRAFGTIRSDVDHDVVELRQNFFKLRPQEIDLFESCVSTDTALFIGAIQGTAAFGVLKHQCFAAALLMPTTPTLKAVLQNIRENETDDRLKAFYNIN